MTGTDYNVALLVFFVPYILFEVPSNMLIKRMAPSTYLSAIMVLWGIGTIGQGLVTNKPGLIAMRVLVGFFEAGLFPGCVYIIGMYYKRYEMQKRLTLFFSASILSGAFAGLLAYAIAGMAGVGGYNGWRWIFIIEVSHLRPYAMALCQFSAFRAWSRSSSEPFRSGGSLTGQRRPSSSMTKSVPCSSPALPPISHLLR